MIATALLWETQGPERVDASETTAERPILLKDTAHIQPSSWGCSCSPDNTSKDVVQVKVLPVRRDRNPGWVTALEDWSRAPRRRRTAAPAGRQQAR